MTNRRKFGPDFNQFLVRRAITKMIASGKCSVPHRRLDDISQLMKSPPPEDAPKVRPELYLSIVVPVYNSAKTLTNLLARLTTVLASITQSYEIILVDDGSGDDTWSEIERMRAQYGEHLVAVQLMRNYGQHNALMCGLALARGKYVLTMDDDLQNPPEEIPKLLAHIRQHGLDLVYGCPPKHERGGWGRRHSLRKSNCVTPIHCSWTL